MNIATISKQIRAFADQLDATSEVEKPDPYAELKAAHTAGKVIQVRRSDGSYLDIEPDETPAWGAPVDEYRIKPEEPALQLPPPPPGVQWIKGEWKSGDLPQGTRPLAVGEHVLAGDEWKTLCEGTWLATRIEEPCVGRAPTSPQIRRTTRPLTFEHAGKTWTWHRPGDPMPCDGERYVCAILAEGTFDEEDTATKAKLFKWNDQGITSIIGWRYADPQTKTVPLGPEDVPPGSVFRSKDQPTTAFWTVSQVWEDGFYLRGDSMPWNTARERMQINRSLSKGQWNPDAWEPCSKTLPA